MGIDLRAMNALIDSFASDVYPILFDFLERSEPLQGFNSTQSIIGGTASALVAGFFVETLDEDKIAISTQESLPSSDSISLSVSSGPVRAGFAEVGLAFDITIFTQFLCDVLGTISIEFSSIIIDIEVTPYSNEPSSFNVSAKEVRIEGASLSIDPNVDGDICSDFNNLVEILLNLLSTSLELLFALAVQREILDFDITIDMPPTTFNVPQIDPIDIMDNELHLIHNISNLYATRDAFFCRGKLEP